MSEHTFNVSLWSIAAAVVYIVFCMWLWRKSKRIPLEPSREGEA